MLWHAWSFSSQSWPANASKPQQAMRQHGAETSEESCQTGTQSAQRHGQTGGGDAVWVATKLKLLNSGNTCYIFVRAVTWMLDTTGGQVSIMGRGANAWHTIMSQATSFAVTQLFPWSALQQGWRQGGRQHDTRVLEKCQATPFHGRWEARVLESHGMRIVDAGVCEGAINMDPPPEGHWMLDHQCSGRLGSKCLFSTMQPCPYLRSVSG